MGREPTEHEVDEEARQPGPPRIRVSDFLRQRRDAILRSWEARVTSEQREVVLAGPALQDDLPPFLDELATWLASDAAPEASLVAARARSHVTQRLDQGLSLAQLFREYRLLRETVIEEVLGAEAAEQGRAGASGEASRLLRAEELARLNAGLDVVLSRSIEQFVAERDRRAAAQRASAEQALRDSEARSRSLFESIDEGFCIIEVLFERERPVDYRFLEVNPAFEKHTGLKNATGQRAREMLPDLDEHWFETYGRVAQTGEPARFEDASRPLRRMYDVYAFRVGAPAQRQVAVLFSDITERRRAAEALRETEARVHSVTNNLPDTVVYQLEARLDGARHFTYMSGGVAGLFGCTAEQATADASAIYGRFLEEDRQRLADEEREVLTHLVPFKTESRIRRASGEVGWIYAASAPRRRHDGSIVWDGVIIDITDRKRAEEQIKEANRQLAEADRRKNEFLAVLSHELRNPLAPIRNSVYILERAAPGGEQAIRARQVIDRQAQHMARLIEDLLDVTRISRGKVVLQRERVDLNAIARGTAEDHREIFARGGVDLEIVAADRPLWIDGDRTRLAQVIGNLLTNSAKFTPRGGRTVLAVEERADHAAVVRVRDTGAGMSPETLAHLFEPFVQGAQTIDRTRGGLGLGLALVKGLVELHDGTVTAHSEGEGRGAELVVTLPLQSQVAATLELGRGPLPRAKARRVLVIEDNADSAESLRAALLLDGHEVTVAHSGPEGLEAARAHEPDVILCDIGLPGIDGHEVARSIRADPDARLRRTFLVALSGYALPEDVNRSREAGFDRHIAKPPSIEALGKLLDEVADRGAS